ncbi:MAG: N-acetyltransferase [Vulcanimicrobiota bacterium]
MNLRKARLSDAEAIHQVVNHFAQKGLMLPKRLVEVFEQIREFTIAESDDGELLGCGALRLMWYDLAEVRSLAIHEKAHGTGLGRRITEALIEEARELELGRVFALTYQVGFFEKLGFEVVSKNIFPQKVWLDCQACPKQDCCDEIAVLRVLDPSKVLPASELLEEPISGRRQIVLPVRASQ